MQTFYPAITNRAAEPRQRVVAALRSQPVQFRDELGDRLNRLAVAVDQGIRRMCFTPALKSSMLSCT